MSLKYDSSMIFVRKIGFKSLVALGVLLFLFPASPALAVPGGAYPYRFPSASVPFSAAQTVVGVPQKHVVEKKETFLDIARDYDLGFNELEDLYPLQDPWIPPEGMKVVIPSQWVLPDVRRSGIVINIAELRLYYFIGKIKMVRTFPVGIGDSDWQSPVSGLFRITDKRVHPTWYVPESLQEKYGVKTMPPGPENPLGDFWMGLGYSSYGIHGTNFPWAVGRLVTHGCIRLYPEDIELLFGLVEPGTPVEIIYEPVKIGLRAGRVYVEAHRDIYNRLEDFDLYAFSRLKKSGVFEKVDLKKFTEAIDRRDGLPVDVTLMD